MQYHNQYQSNFLKIYILELFPLFFVFMKNIIDFEDKEDRQATLTVN